MRGLTTYADLFRQRYSRGVERLVVIVLLPGSVIWAAAQIRAFGQVLAANSSLGLGLAIALAAGLVAAYSVVGGLLADAVTDVVQGVAVLGGLLVLGVVAAVGLGGVSFAGVAPEKLRVFGSEQDWLSIAEQLAIPVCGTIVAVELISRFLGARSERVAQAGTLAGGLIYLIAGLVPVFLGLAAPRLLPGVPMPSRSSRGWRRPICRVSFMSPLPAPSSRRSCPPFIRHCMRLPRSCRTTSSCGSAPSSARWESCGACALR